MERGAGLSSITSPLAESHDQVLLDLDGVVYVGPDAVAYAADTIGALRTPVAYLTNNATRAAAEVADHLRSFGLQLAELDVVTAGQVVAELVHREVGDGAAVLLAGADGMRVALEERGLVVVSTVEDGARAVVQGGVIDVRWSQLAEASYAVASGLPWFASNPDLTFPTPRGLAPGNGAFVEAVKLTTDTRPVVAGKPSRPIFDEARNRSGASSPLMVGDRLDTDIDGAISAGIDSMLVLTGVTTLADLVTLPVGHRPSYVAADLRGLLQSHPPVQVSEGSATCAGAVATISDGRLRVAGPGSEPPVQDLSALRALVALAWSTRDRGGPVSVEDVRMEP